MTVRDDRKEACRLLLAAGVPKEEITPAAVIVADKLIKDMARRLAERLAQRLFPEFTRNTDDTNQQPALSGSRHRR
jgi:hypothetical protein